MVATATMSVICIQINFIGIRQMNTDIQKLIELESLQGTDFVFQSIDYPMTDEAKACGLTDTEFMMIRMMTSNGEGLVQRHLYAGNQPSDLEVLLCQHLDSALQKLPTETTTEEVFRWDTNPIIKQDQVGQIINYPAYLTASKVNLSTNLDYLYIIHLSKNTSARCFYKVYEIMPFAPEWQVEFPRATKFYVDSYMAGNDGKVIIEITEQ